MSTDSDLINVADTIEVLKLYFKGKMVKHIKNVYVMLNAPMAIHDHTDYISAIEKEIEAIAEYDDKLSVLNKYFSGKME